MIYLHKKIISQNTDMQKVCANSRPQWWVFKTNLPAAIRQSLWKKLIWKWKQTWLNVAWVLWFDVCTSRCLINIVYSSNERVIIFLSIFLFSVFYAHIKCLGSLFTFYTGRLFWNCNIKPVWGIFSIQMIFFFDTLHNDDFISTEFFFAVMVSE